MHKLNLETADDYRQVLNQMAVKRAIERLMLGFICVCIVAVMLQLFFQNRILSEQVDNQKTEIANQEKASAAQTQLFAQNQAELERLTKQTQSFVLCIGQFFADRDRATKTLDINTCSIKENAQASITMPASPPAAAPAKSSSKPPAKHSPQQAKDPTVGDRVGGFISGVIKGLGGLL